MYEVMIQTTRTHLDTEVTEVKTHTFIVNTITDALDRYQALKDKTYNNLAYCARTKQERHEHTTIGVYDVEDEAIFYTTVATYSPETHKFEMKEV